MWQLNLIAKVGLPLFFCLVPLSPFSYSIYHFYLLYLFFSLLPHFFFICSLCLFTRSACPLTLQSRCPFLFLPPFSQSAHTPLTYLPHFDCKIKAVPLSLNNNAIASQIQRLCRVKAVTLRTTYLQRDFKGIENENEGQNNSVQKRHLWSKKKNCLHLQ